MLFMLKNDKKTRSAIKVALLQKFEKNEKLSENNNKKGSNEYQNKPSRFQVAPFSR